jgi:hypothetical protein
MNRKRFTAGALLICVLIFAIVTPGHVQGQDKKDPYPRMAPLDQYLIADRNAEIALARTAAPPSVSGDATVVILGPHGFETAAQARMGLSASSNGRGRAHSTVWSFGTLRIAARFATTRRRREPSCPSPICEPDWRWQENRRPKSKTV